MEILSFIGESKGWVTHFSAFKIREMLCPLRPTPCIFHHPRPTPHPPSLVLPGLSLFRDSEQFVAITTLSPTPERLNTSLLQPGSSQGLCKVAPAREKGWQALVLLFSGCQGPNKVPGEAPASSSQASMENHSEESISCPPC